MELNESYGNLPYGSNANQIATGEDYDLCRQIMRRASQRYSFASNFLPVEKLKHVEALYAFLRVGDDRVDVSHAGFSSPQAAIEDWERTYWRAFETGDSHDPVMRAYLNTALECGIPRATMAPYFRAMEEDLTITSFPTFAHLAHYMDGSAVPVGRGMTYILGIRQPYHIEEALPHADSLSIAMQLSNFLRDVGQDFGIGRIYLPLEDLDRFGVSEEDLEQGRLTPQFKQLMEFEIERTAGYYDQASKGITKLATGRWGVMSGLAIYQAILADIRRIRYDVFRRRAVISKPRKIALAAWSWWQVHGI
ncbi:MAG TPA: phytoene/squalene synthase family protein [Anaerolineales bacterium]|nr:phytoene/squalene synthase family protein [Anaerolineales bacterium]